MVDLLDALVKVGAIVIVMWQISVSVPEYKSELLVLFRTDLVPLKLPEICYEIVLIWVLTISVSQLGFSRLIVDSLGTVLVFADR